jgi:ferrous iron transport protein B
MTESILSNVKVSLSQAPDTALPLIAVAGNPNNGKSTLFNALTGLRQKVANYPGVTVEKKMGRFFGLHGEPMNLLDLPGTYSLQTRSSDEAVSRDVLLGRQAGLRRPDVILCVVDATNLERNLYFAVQLSELGIPMVIALTMMDVADAQGLVLDFSHLSSMLGAPVVPVIASKGEKGWWSCAKRSSANCMAARPAAPRFPMRWRTLPNRFGLRWSSLAARMHARHSPKH